MIRVPNGSNVNVCVCVCVYKHCETALLDLTRLDSTIHGTVLNPVAMNRTGTTSDANSVATKCMAQMVAATAAAACRRRLSDSTLLSDAPGSDYRASSSSLAE